MCLLENWCERKTSQFLKIWSLIFFPFIALKVAAAAAPKKVIAKKVPKTITKKVAKVAAPKPAPKKAVAKKVSPKKAPAKRSAKKAEPKKADETTISTVKLNVPEESKAPPSKNTMYVLLLDESGSMSG